PASFYILVPNPEHLAFDRISDDTSGSQQALAEALPLIEKSAGGPIDGRVANSPNAYDDIAEELCRHPYNEIILQTPPHHASHWLHVDLPERVRQLGLPLTTVTATA